MNGKKDEKARGKLEKEIKMQDRKKKRLGRRRQGKSETTDQRREKEKGYENGDESTY